MKKKIYYSSVGVHSYLKALIENPPEGYEFIVDNGENKKEFINSFKKRRFIVFLYKNIIKRFFNVFKFLNNFYYKQSPENIDLILSTGSLISEKRPWIIKILDSPFSMAGNDYHVFMKNKEAIEKALSSDYCKRIIVHTKIARKYMQKYFSKKVLKKVIILTPAIPGRIKKKSYKNKKGVNLLFMGSINNPEEFFLKGGLETLETFKILSEKYKNIKLFMRCKIPKEIKDKYKMKNVEFLESFLPPKEIEKLYSKSDIMLMPGYNYFIMAYLEAFSFGIPIVALDTYGVSEFIINGKNGFCIRPSESLPINSPEYPVNAKSTDFIRKIKEGDTSVIEELAKKAGILIENRKLREKMGKESQRMLKEGYSFEKKRRILKKIFDEAII